jgi:hypothetical protein
VKIKAQPTEGDMAPVFVTSSCECSSLNFRALETLEKFAAFPQENQEHNFREWQELTG